MSAFDDEFGLFGDEEVVEDDERRSTLGARQIATGETVIDDIEPEDDRPRRRRQADAGDREPRAPRSGGGAGGGGRFRNGSGGGRRDSRAGTSVPATEASARRAGELLYFLATKLVTRPETVAVQIVPGGRQGPTLELEVDSEDIGKVIGRSGRVAQALRTLVRAGAEGRVGIEIIEVESLDESGSEPANDDDAATE